MKLTDVPCGLLQTISMKTNLRLYIFFRAYVLDSNDVPERKIMTAAIEKMGARAVLESGTIPRWGISLDSLPDLGTWFLKA